MATYTVQAGDTLPSIARTFLGTTGRWRELQLYNQHLLVDPSRVAPGMVLRLPPGAALPSVHSAPSDAAHVVARVSSGERTRIRTAARSGQRRP